MCACVFLGEGVCVWERVYWVIDLGFEQWFCLEMNLLLVGQGFWDSFRDAL